MKTYTTTLSSANFALNAVEGDAIALARAFVGMSEETARNILSGGRERLTFPSRNAIGVPDDLVA